MEAERARELLARERARIESELRGIAADADGEGEATGDDAAELYEAELDAGQAEDLRAELAAVERAEQRLADGKFGLSVESGEPIPDGRLEAVPTAERTIAEQERHDAGH
jgi:RNA polymerase-binding transcription factor